MGPAPRFVTIFAKGNNFIDYFSSKNEVLQNGSVLKGKNLANSSLQKFTPIEKGGKKENGRVTSPESVPIHLNSSKRLTNMVFYRWRVRQQQRTKFFID